MVRAFCAEIEALVTGSDGHESLLQLCRPAHRKLKCGIVNTAPNFRPFADASKDVKGLRFHAVLNQEDASWLSCETSSPPIYLQDVKSCIQGYESPDLRYFHAN